MGTHFESAEAVKTKSTEVLKALQETYFQHCFNRRSDVLNVKRECIYRRRKTIENCRSGESRYLTAAPRVVQRM